MRKLLIASTKMIWRDKQALFWAMAFPIIFVVSFGLFDFDRGPDVHIAVVAERPSPIVTGLVSGLDQVDTFLVEDAASTAAARRDLAAGRLDLVIDVPAPAGRQQPAAVTVFYDERNVETNRLVLSTVRQIVDATNLEIAGVASPPLRVRERAVSGRSIDFYDFILPGFVAIGVMNFSIIGVAVSVTRYREQEILKRILATPLSPVRFITAQVLARLVVALAQAGLVMLMGVQVFGGHIYGNVGWMFLLAAIGNIIFLNLGFAVAGQSRNVDAAQGMATVLALPMMFLAGVFSATETLPEIMQRIVHYLPLTPLIEAMRKVALDAQSITDMDSQLLRLGAWVVASFVLARLRFRFATDEAKPRRRLPIPGVLRRRARTPQLAPAVVTVRQPGR